MKTFNVIEGTLRVLLNLLFLIFGGFIIAIEYFLGGLLLCATIIGIPFGFQCFKLGVAVLAPFGKEIDSIDQSIGMGCLATICNIVWIFTFGIALALSHLLCGLILCITIVGIPLGSQHFKLMSLAFAPFGKELVKS